MAQEGVQPELRSCIEENKRLVIMLVAKEDVRSGPLASIMTNLGLKDAILGSYPSIPAPATHTRGSRPIHAIFVSSDLHPQRAGWLPLGDSLGDHRAGYIDIPWTEVL